MAGTDRAALLAQVAEAHYGWVQDHLPDAEQKFTPNPDSGDANVWQLEATGDPDQEADFASRVNHIDFSQASGGLPEGDDNEDAGDGSAAPELPEE